VSFTELLDRVLNETPGAVSVTLMGFDGIAIETRDAPEQPDVSPQSAAIELGAVATQLKGVAEGLGAGEVQELTLQTGALTTLLRPVTADYFVALSLRPGGNTGKGRYLLRVVAPKLVAKL